MRKFYLTPRSNYNRGFNSLRRPLLIIIVVMGLVLSTVYLILVRQPEENSETISRAEAVKKVRNILENDFENTQLKLLGAKLHRPEENEITFSKGSKQSPDLIWTVKFELWRMSLNQVATVHLDARTGGKIGIIEILS